MVRIKKNVVRQKQLFFGVGLSVAFGGIVLLASCSTNNDGPTAGAGSTLGPSGGCATPNTGCPCATGQTAECAVSTTGANSFVMCQHGTRSCVGNVWGACNLNGTLSAKSYGPITIVSGLVIQGLGAPQSCSANNNDGGTTGTFQACSGGTNHGQLCTTGADCPSGEKRCSGGTDSTNQCRQNSECQVACTTYSGHCNGGTNDQFGCNTDTDCPGGGTCPATGGGGNCATFSGICGTGDIHNGDGCATDADCGGGVGSCALGNHGTCAGGASNGKACTLDSQCLAGDAGDAVCSFAVASDGGESNAGDPCDPYCNVFADNGSGIGGDGGDDSGLVAVDGGAVRAAGCGDGILEGTEQCDDGNLTNGDGCSSVCSLELDYICPTPGQPCHPTDCGNGIKEGGEECDDGNNQAYDGCSPTCQIEPVCPPGGCIARCGDGLKFPSEECDDGNTRDGDGCDHNCHIESGATCTTTTATPPSSISPPIVYRDFRGADETANNPTPGLPAGNPDFEKNPICGSAVGIMANNLNGSQRPVRGSYSGSCVTSTASWSEWYSNASPDNRTINSNLTLNLITPTPATYQYASTAFFPLDGNPAGFGNYEASGHDFGFTSELRFPFTYAGGEQLTFVGDDDVYVFINDKLAIDLGGVHAAETGTITLTDAPNNRTQNGTTDTFGIVSGGLSLNVGTTYQIVVFQAERHTVGSDYTLTLSGFDSTESVCTPAEQKTTLYRDYCATDDPSNPCPPDAEVACPAGTKVVWQTFQWQAQVPTGTEIDFSAATTDDISTLPTTPPASPPSVPIGVANASNSPLGGPETWQNLTSSTPPASCDLTGTLPVAVPVSCQLSSVANMTSQKYLRVYMTFVTTGGASPQLDQWHQFFDCVPNE